MKRYRVKINGKTFNVELESVEEFEGAIKEAKPVTEEKEVVKREGSVEILSPIQGTVLDVLVTKGKKVKKGDVLLLIEAMKLENEVNAPSDGEIVDIVVSKGQAVASNDLLITMK